jgi:hypothetical protein
MRCFSTVGMLLLVLPILVDASINQSKYDSLYSEVSQLLESGTTPRELLQGYYPVLLIGLAGRAQQLSTGAIIPHKADLPYLADDLKEMQRFFTGRGELFELEWCSRMARQTIARRKLHSSLNREQNELLELGIICQRELKRDVNWLANWLESNPTSLKRSQTLVPVRIGLISDDSPEYKAIRGYYWRQSGWWFYLIATFAAALIIAGFLLYTSRIKLLQKEIRSYHQERELLKQEYQETRQDLEQVMTKRAEQESQQIVQLNRKINELYNRISVISDRKIEKLDEDSGDL